jgi:hypothetical protein
MISMVASEQRNPGLEFCLGIAKALDETPEAILRRAGLLPAIPKAVAEEEQACRTFRELSDPARLMALELLRALSTTNGEGWGAVADARAPYRVGRPRSASDWIRQEVDRLLPDLSLADQQRVLDLAQGLHDGEAVDADAD